MKKKLAIAGLLSGLVLFLWWGAKAWGYDWFLTLTGPKDKPYYSGSIEGTMVPVQPEQGGRVVALAVDEGQEVQQGDIIARLDDRAARISLAVGENQLKQAEARLNELLAGSRSEEIRRLQASLEQAKASFEGYALNLKHEEKTLQDLQALHAAGAVSHKEVDVQQNKRDSVKAQSEAAKAQMDSAQATLDLALSGFTQPTILAQRAAVEAARENVKAQQLFLEKTEIRSPVKGTVLYKHIELGQVVNSGSRLITLSDREDLWVKVYVPEDKLNQVSKGGPAMVSVDAYPEQTFRGEVKWIADKAEFTPKNVQTREERTTIVFGVKVQIKEGQEQLKVGMPADVVFQGSLQ